jgi:hypothetical protein
VLYKAFRLHYKWGVKTKKASKSSRGKLLFAGPNELNGAGSLRQSPGLVIRPYGIGPRPAPQFHLTTNKSSAVLVTPQSLSQGRNLRTESSQIHCHDSVGRQERQGHCDLSQLQIRMQKGGVFRPRTNPALPVQTVQKEIQRFSRPSLG